MSPVEETGSGLGAAGTGFLRTETPVLGRVGPASGDPWRYSLRQSLKTWGENLAWVLAWGQGGTAPLSPSCSCRWDSMCPGLRSSRPSCPPLIGPC